MFTLTVMDSDKWIAAGISQYFNDRHIKVTVMTDEQDSQALKLAAESNIVISELYTAGRDVQAVCELFVMLRMISPSTRLIFLTDLREKAVIKYITALLPNASVLPKSCDIHRLASEVFSCASRSDDEITSLNVKRKSGALTAKEFGLLRVLATNDSLTDIGCRLQLSVKTISQHRKNIIRKLNCHTAHDLSTRLIGMGFGNNKSS
ncbi:DNA-binding NarL/FixJ family response regulator [Pantoea sp. AG1095]|uniref:helix-turn-helix transcriptional regulator n=1 Tax=Pantoea sp. AG1095 TaxID=2184004 RepID=UPI000DA07CB8|nr:LuxR C-terminal-related transcriptional regulator [Pantoea sp. AG1095]PYG47214.1 DNA-binding NarL/FixJ family response regulator [Pantoea sp. AG1095]